MLTGYLAKEGLEHVVEKQLTRIVDKIGSLFIVEGSHQPILFVQECLVRCSKNRLLFDQDQAAKELKAIGKLWSLYPLLSVRRATLISEKLSYFKSKPIPFPLLHSYFSTRRLDSKKQNTLYASARTSSSFAQGEVLFRESKEPPSRAYLKLWEALTLTQKMPLSSETCLEIGASPGSWTWVLQKMAKKVIAVDRAPLADFVQRLENVFFLKKDAFSLLPQDFPEVNWVFSDVICYPEKLLEWVLKWLEVNPKINFVCTLKFQGECDYKIVNSFLEIEGSTVFHLFHNKHELTWALIH
jgi:23S rRNA (cytidine2498-2'-O)-methyltransferase